MNTIDFKSLVDFAKLHDSNLSAALKEDGEISEELDKVRNNNAFLEQTLAALAKITSVNFSIKDTFAACDTDTRFLLMFLVSYPFSNIAKRTQGKSEINSATPLFLYAQRLYNGISYDAWTRDEYLKYGLSRELQPILDIEFPNWSEEEWMEARVKSVTSADGTRHDFSAYKCNIKIGELSRFFRHMYLKTWIFAEPKSSMIISLDKYDNNIPQKLKEAVPTIKKSVSYELPF